jgi:hypothetical protein
MRTAPLGIVLAAFALLFAASSARSATQEQALELMEPYFKNTLICKIPGLFECHVYFWPDGRMVQFSYDVRTGANAMDLDNDMHGLVGLPGKWTVEGAPGALKLCRQLGAVKQPRCNLETPKKVGDTWLFVHKTGPLAGLTETFTLVAGRK